MPQDTPALYSLMNYAGIKSRYLVPAGWFWKSGRFHRGNRLQPRRRILFQCPVEKIIVENSKATGVLVDGEVIACDAVVAAADYHYVENCLLPKSMANYTETYWQKKTFAPSCLIYFIGLIKKINNLNHHTLFFDEDLMQHSKEIYKSPQWPTKPLFYVCCPSRSDDGVAPDGHENLFLLMPIASGLQDNENIREKYFDIMMNRIERYLGRISGIYRF